MQEMSALYRIGNAKTRSISPENPTGAPGKGGMCPLEEGSARRAARDLGTGWKVNPYIVLPEKATVEIAAIDGPGIINHIWLTPTGRWRNTILRIYWDGQENPSVECPIGDFFCMGWNEYAQISSLAVCVNPGSAFNCYWQMPFKSHCRMTLENRAEEPVTMYYQIDYTLRRLPEEIAYFHAQFRRVNPLPYKQDYVILDGVEGKGQYVGTYMAWGSNSACWWGRGRDQVLPRRRHRISHHLRHRDGGLTSAARTTLRIRRITTAICRSRRRTRGCRSSSRTGCTAASSGLGCTGGHIADPIHFDSRLRVTIQALGWREGGRYLPLQDDIASVAYWYQTLPAAKFPPASG